MNPTTTATPHDHAAIAHLIARIRPDWNPRSITTLLATAPTQDLATLTIATLIATTTQPTLRTPAPLTRHGDHWTTAATALGTTPTPTPAQPPLDRCDTCGQLWTRHTTTDHPYRHGTHTQATPQAITQARTRAGLPPRRAGLPPRRTSP